MLFENINLINFIDLNNEEKKMVLSWRNHPNIKKWMYSQNTILLKNHLNFIKSLKNEKNKLYFVVKNRDTYLGIIDFTNITTNNTDMGIYANPSLKGVGKTLLQTIVQYAFKILMVKTIFAEVFSDNLKAINLYYFFGFKKVGSKIVNNKEVLRLKLKNENM